MIDDFIKLIPESLLDVSGSVFYSGRSAFSAPSKLYIVGLNPGGSPEDQASETVRWHTHKVLNGPTEWSAYRDESWKGDPAGTHGMQPGVLRMLSILNLNPRNVPSSNVVFERSGREDDLRERFRQLADICWPFHEEVISSLGVRVVLCFGKRSSDFVRKRLGATESIDQFVEMNNRKWTSTAFANSKGLAVVQVTHPSIADWTTKAADPSPMVKRVFEGAV